MTHRFGEAIWPLGKFFSTNFPFPLGKFFVNVNINLRMYIFPFSFPCVVPMTIVIVTSTGYFKPIIFILTLMLPTVTIDFELLALFYTLSLKIHSSTLHSFLGCWKWWQGQAPSLHAIYIGKNWLVMGWDGLSHVPNCQKDVKMSCANLWLKIPNTFHFKKLRTLWHFKNWYLMVQQMENQLYIQKSKISHVEYPGVHQWINSWSNNECHLSFNPSWMCQEANL